MENVMKGAPTSDFGTSHLGSRCLSSRCGAEYRILAPSPSSDSGQAPPAESRRQSLTVNRHLASLSAWILGLLHLTSVRPYRSVYVCTYVPMHVNMYVCV